MTGDKETTSCIKESKSPKETTRIRTEPRLVATLDEVLTRVEANIPCLAMQRRVKVQVKTLYDEWAARGHATLLVETDYYHQLDDEISVAFGAWDDIGPGCNRCTARKRKAVIKMLPSQERLLATRYCQINMACDGYLSDLLTEMEQDHRLESPNTDIERQHLCASRKGGVCDCCRSYVELPSSLRVAMARIVQWEDSEKRDHESWMMEDSE